MSHRGPQRSMRTDPKVKLGKSDSTTHFSDKASQKWYSRLIRDSSFATNIKVARLVKEPAALDHRSIKTRLDKARQLSGRRFARALKTISC